MHRHVAGISGPTALGHGGQSAAAPARSSVHDLTVPDAISVSLSPARPGHLSFKLGQELVELVGSAQAVQANREREAAHRPIRARCLGRSPGGTNHALPQRPSISRRNPSQPAARAPTPPGTVANPATARAINASASTGRPKQYSTQPNTSARSGVSPQASTAAREDRAEARSPPETAPPPP